MDHDWVDEGGEAHGGHEVALERAALGAGTGDDGASSGGEGPLEEPHGPVDRVGTDIGTEPMCGSSKSASFTRFSESEWITHEEPEDGCDEEVDGILHTDGPAIESSSVLVLVMQVVRD